MTDVPAFVRNGRLDVLAANTWLLRWRRRHPTRWLRAGRSRAAYSAGGRADHGCCR
nr:hypothetical protein [Frankia sp. R43]